MSSPRTFAHAPAGVPALSPVAAWAACEILFAADGYAGAGGPDSLIQHAGGPVVLTAPHSVHHPRNGRLKRADAATGGLALTLAELTGSCVLTCDGPPSMDGNYDLDGPFKVDLARLLGVRTAPVVLDLHGMRDEHGVDICLGLGPDPGPSAQLAAVVAAALRAAGLVVSVNTPFDASWPGTVTAFAQRHQVPAVQLEIARRLRRPATAPQLADALVVALSAAVTAAGQVAAGQVAAARRR